MHGVLQLMGLAWVYLCPLSLRVLDSWDTAEDRPAGKFVGQSLERWTSKFMCLLEKRIEQKEFIVIEVV